VTRRRRATISSRKTFSRSRAAATASDRAASSVLLPARIGPQAAAYHLLTGDWMDAETAVARGLAWQRCAPEELLPTTLGIAQRIAGGTVDAVRNTKRLLLAARSDAVAAALDREQGFLDEIVAHFVKPMSS
jgi:enoyl-CoA hydratase/carnithine racemase